MTIGRSRCWHFRSPGTDTRIIITNGCLKELIIKIRVTLSAFKLHRSCRERPQDIVLDQNYVFWVTQSNYGTLLGWHYITGRLFVWIISDKFECLGRLH